MPGKYAKKRKFPVFPLIAILILVLVAVAVLLLRDKLPADPTEPSETAAETTLPPETTVPPTTVPPTTVPPPVNVIETTASFTVTGDLLAQIHGNFIKCRTESIPVGTAFTQRLVSGQTVGQNDDHIVG